MKIETLEEFVCLANTLNFGAAAKKCFISQSTLSKHINALEKELGCQIFERSNRQVSLTPIGEVLNENVSGVLEAYKKCISVVDQMKNSSPAKLNIGYLYSAAHRLIMGIYDVFSESNPTSEVRFIRGQGEMLLYNLQNGTFDLVFDMDFGGYDVSRFDILPLYSDSYGVILPVKHPLAQKSSLTLAELRDETFILPSRKYFESHWNYLHRILTDEIGENVKIEDVLSDPNELSMYVRRGDGIGLLVGHAVHTTDMTGMKYVSLAFEPFKFNVCAIWLKSSKSAVLEDFVDATKTMILDEEFRNMVIPPLP